MNDSRAPIPRFASEVEADVVSRLLEMPFLDQQELAKLADWPVPTIYKAVKQLENQGLVSSVQVSQPSSRTTGRFHVTMAGVEAAAEFRGVPADSIMERFPVSGHWIRLLLARLDGIIPIYRLASLLSDVASVKSFHWYRKLTLDAIFELDGDRMFGVIREGRSALPSHLAGRLRSLFHIPHPDTIFVIAPDPLHLRDWCRLLSRLPFKAFLAYEPTIFSAQADSSIWSLPSDPKPRPLTSIIHMAYGGNIPREKALFTVSEPPCNLDRKAQVLRGGAPSGRAQESLLPVALKAGEKRALDLLALWPWITSVDMTNMLGVSRERVLQMLDVPQRLKLVIRIKYAEHHRYLLSGRGLGFLARRDRLAIPAVLRRWNPSGWDNYSYVDWRNLKGTRTRRLAREIEHSSAIHRFLGAMSQQARQLGHDLAVLEPSHRCIRTYQYNGSRHTISPDAYGQYRSGAYVHHFFLEWERRAVYPGLLKAKIAPFLQYYATRAPLEQHGKYPVLMVVLKDEIVETHLLRIAQQEKEKAGVTTLQLVASHANLVDVRGPLGKVWRECAGGPRRLVW